MVVPRKNWLVLLPEIVVVRAVLFIHNLKKGLTLQNSNFYTEFKFGGNDPFA